MKIPFLQLVFLPLFLVTSGCALDTNTANNADVRGFRKSMKSAYQSSSKLFELVWNNDRFMDPGEEREIKGLLDELSKNFHRIEKVTDSAGSSSENKTGQAIWNEPGFTIALQAQNDLVTDIKERFREGNKEYAWWKLKGITHNCVACHSRFSSNAEFLGTNVVPDDTSFSARLASLEFLVASRQFTKADRELLSLAEDVSKLEGGTTYSFQALRLWLMVQVRVQESFHGAAVELSRVKDSGKWSGSQAAILSRWIIDLQGLQSVKDTNDPDRNSTDRFAHARKLLGDLDQVRTFDLDDEELVKTARAGALLHHEAQVVSTQSATTRSSSSKDLEHRAEILLLLGVSYQRNTIPSFKVLAPLYLEQCIREFPKTAQAKTAYKLYSREFDLGHTGSGGSHVSDEDSKKLGELKALL